MSHHRCKLLAGQTAHEFSNEFANEVTSTDANELADKVASFADLRQIRSSRTVRLRRRKTAPVDLIETQVRQANCRKSSFLDLAQTNNRTLIPADAPDRLVRAVPVNGAQAARDVQSAAPVPSPATTLRRTADDAVNGSA
jgi:hypothetical protein